MTPSVVDTPVTRLLIQHGIPFRVLAHSKPVFTVEEAARERGAPVDEMLKCMVFQPRRGPRVIVACIPGDRRLSMSKLKAASGIKGFHSAAPDAIAQAIGYPVGAIPPVALPADAVVLADASILRHTSVNISSGDLAAGLDLLLVDLRKVLHCKFADLAE